MRLERVLLTVVFVFSFVAAFASTVAIGLVFGWWGS